MSARTVPLIVTFRFVPTSINSSIRPRSFCALFAQGDPAAVAELRKHHPGKLASTIESGDVQLAEADLAEVKLADAQAALARSYGLASWPRLVTACRMTDAIWRGDVDTVRKLVLKDPRLLHESARGVADSNWGPPMSYAANVGQDAIIAMLREMGAEDLQHAFDRACLQGQIETARRLHAMGARPTPGCVMGPCETLNPEGLAFLLELGARTRRCARRPPRTCRLASANLLPRAGEQTSLSRNRRRARSRSS